LLTFSCQPFWHGKCKQNVPDVLVRADAGLARTLNSIKTNEAIGMGNIVSKVAYQRISKKA